MHDMEEVEEFFNHYKNAHTSSGVAGADLVVEERS